MNYFKTKGIVIIVLFMIYILLVSSVFAEDREPDLESGVENINMRIYEIDGKEMVQLRDLAEQKNWTLAFLEESKEIVIRGNEQLLKLSLNGKSDDSFILEESPVLDQGRTYLSIDSLKPLLEELKDSADFLASIYTDKRFYTDGEDISAHIRLFNLSEQTLSLDFSSGQRYDLYLEKDGEEVWRWSDGKFFTMALARVDLEAGERLEFDIDIDYQFEAGEYILSGKLATVGSPIELDEVELLIED